MHSIERYGIVALLFLVVTVVAVLMWDGGRDEKKKDLVGALSAAPAVPAALDTSADSADAAARLSLVSESQPGPLERRPSEPQAPVGGGVPLGHEPETLAAPLTDSGAPPAKLEASSGPQSLPEQPAPEQVVGQLEAGATHTYTVRPGDTLSEIAQRELGSSRRWQDIVAANPGLDPSKLRVGKPIRIPGAAAQSAAPSQPTPAVAAKGTAKPQAKPVEASSGRATWKVGKGESLWNIAAKTLGDGKRWREIATLNPAIDPDRLTAGQVLKLPSGAVTPGSKAATPASAPALARGTTKGTTKPKAASTLVASNAGSERVRRTGKVK